MFVRGEFWSSACPFRFSILTDISNFISLITDVAVGLQFLLGVYGGMVATFFYCFVVGLTLFLFGMFHVYLIAKNTTTNETFKWEDAQRELDAELRRAGKKHGPKLRNVYNRGIADNFKEVFVEARSGYVAGKSRTIAVPVVPAGAPAGGKRSS